MDNGRKSQEGGLCTYLYLIDVDVWQRPTQYCKAIILQLKTNNLKKMENPGYSPEQGCDVKEISSTQCTNMSFT